MDLINGAAELQLSETDGIFRIVITVRVDEVDKLFDKHIRRY
jgi:hypothetical protein